MATLRGILLLCIKRNKNMYMCGQVYHICIFYRPRGELVGGVAYNILWKDW